MYTTKISKYKNANLPNGKDVIPIVVDSQTLEIHDKSEEAMKKYVVMLDFYREVLYVVSKANVSLREEYALRCGTT